MDRGNRTTVCLHADAGVRSRTAALLARRGMSCLGADNIDALDPAIRSEDIQLALLEVPRGDQTDAMKTIARLREQWPGCTLVSLTPTDDVAATLAALRAGAHRCLREPLDELELSHCISEAFAEIDRSGERINPSHAPDETPRELLAGRGTFFAALEPLRATCRSRGWFLSMLLLDAASRCETATAPTDAWRDQWMEGVGDILTHTLPASALIARLAEGPYACALPHATVSDASNIARLCRTAVRNTPTTEDLPAYGIELNIGIAQSTAGFIENEESLLERASLAAHYARSTGGDRTLSWDALMADHGDRIETRKESTREIAFGVACARQQRDSVCMEATRSLVAAADARDPYANDHSMKVSAYAEALGRRAGLDHDAIETLRKGALLHDVGKIGIPDAILTKPGPLTPEEFDIIKKHPEHGLRILDHASFLNDARPLILHHHERYDGQGYPTGLSGQAIPLGARIIAVADAIDTMTSARSYKPAYGIGRVRQELMAGAGRQFDPNIAHLALRWLDEDPEAIVAQQD